MFCDSQTIPNTCYPNLCNNDLDCLGPSLCGVFFANRCTIYTDGVCTSDFGCDYQNGQVCDIDSGKCFNTCKASADCSSGNVCDFRGRCTPPIVNCRADADCGSAQVCNTVKQQCIDKPSPCVKWTDCFFPGGTYCHVF